MELAHVFVIRVSGAVKAENQGARSVWVADDISDGGDGGHVWE